MNSINSSYGREVIVSDGNLQLDQQEPTSPVANSTEWPAELLMQQKHVFSIVMYSLLFVVAAPANVSVIVTLLNKRKRIKRLNLMLLHLAIADLIVSCYTLSRTISSCDL